MRKVLLFLILAFSLASCGTLALSTFSPLISLDRMEDGGTRRQIMSESIDLKLDGAKYSFSVKVFDYNGYRDWLLLVSSFSPIPNDGKLLIKLGNQEVITLPVNNVHVGDIDVSGIYGYYKTVDYYSSVYELSPSDFVKIKESGIIKVRISTPYSYRDKDFSTNSLGNHITRCKEQIDNRLATTRHKSITEDF